MTPVALRDDLIVQSTGKLVGVARDYLLRLDQNGVADSTFGFWPGVPPIHPPGTAFIVAPPLRVAEINNHIFTVGPLDSTTFNAGSDLGTNMLSLDGVLDGSYGATGPTPGSMRFTIPGSSVGGVLRLLADGSGGLIEPLILNTQGGPRSALARFTPAGILDPAFGVNGVVTSPSTDEFQDAARDTSGRIVVAESIASNFPPEALLRGAFHRVGGG